MNSYERCEPNIKLNIKALDDIIRKYLYKYLLTDKQDFSKLTQDECENVRKRIGAMWFGIYLAIILLFIVLIVPAIVLCLNCSRKMDRLNQIDSRQVNKIKDYFENVNELKRKEEKPQSNKKQIEEKPQAITDTIKKPEERRFSQLKPIETKRMSEPKHVVREEEEYSKPEKVHGHPKPIETESDSSVKNRQSLLDGNNIEQLIYYKPQSCFNQFPLGAMHDYEFLFPVSPDESELYMKLLIQQLAKRNHSVETSLIRKIADSNHVKKAKRAINKELLKYTYKKVKKYLKD